MPDGDLEPAAYEHMGVVAGWMKTNGVAIEQVRPLADGEAASVPATASGATRYLFALPTFKGNGANEQDLLAPVDETLTLAGVARPSSVTLMDRGPALTYSYEGNTVTIQLPAAVRTKLVDVV